jgi:hypothetical protein
MKTLLLNEIKDTACSHSPLEHLTKKMTKLALILVVVAATLQIQAAPLATLKLKFKISGRYLA